MPQDTDGAFIVRDDVLQAMNLDAAMKPIKQWDHRVGDTFVWHPQSTFVTVQEIDAIAKEFAQDATEQALNI